MENALQSQNKIVLEHLRTHKNITDAEAYELYGIRRLSARIFDLKASGEIIVTQMVTEPNRFGKKTRFAKYILCA